MPSLDTAMSYHRLKRASLDDSEVFRKIRDLMDYCKDGAAYPGQRVTVIGDIESRNINYTTEYYIVEHIRRYIPIINVRGFDHIFKRFTFDGDSSSSYGLLIYENNKGGLWSPDDSKFSLKEGRFSLLDQLEIFRILDAAGNMTFKFYMERQQRNSNTIHRSTWTQNFNPHFDAILNYDKIQQTSGAAITSICLADNSNKGHLLSNNSDIYLMPAKSDQLELENNYITRIYVKAELYYNALNSEY